MTLVLSFGRDDPSTVSEHLAVLHRAGLVTRRRYRHSVVYQQAPLGAQLTQARST